MPQSVQTPYIYTSHSSDFTQHEAVPLLEDGMSADRHAKPAAQVNDENKIRPKVVYVSPSCTYIHMSFRQISIPAPALTTRVNN
jgi:hypothetical protein